MLSQQFELKQNTKQLEFFLSETNKTQQFYEFRSNLQGMQKAKGELALQQFTVSNKPKSDSDFYQCKTLFYKVFFY